MSDSKIYDVILIVEKAADLAMNTDFSITQKGTRENIVTSSDVAVQEFLTSKLKSVTPECGFLGEENHLSDLNYDYVWVIDPIDGTANYSRKIKNCAISVALLYKSKPVLGVVYNIFNKDVFFAVSGKGAYLNGNKIKVSPNPFENSLLCTAMSLYEKKYAHACFEIIEEAYDKCNDLRRFGSCALELCYLAAGMCDLYFEIRIFPWDYAAAYLILTEAGGTLKGFNGEELTFDKPTALIGANSYKNFEILNSIVLKHLKKLPY